MKTSRAATSVLTFLDVLFFLSLLMLPLAWILDPLKVIAGPCKMTVSWGLKPLVAPLLIVAIRVCVSAWFRRKSLAAAGTLGRTWAKKLTLAVAVTYLTIGALEGTLALMDFKIEMAPVIFNLKHATIVRPLVQSGDLTTTRFMMIILKLRGKWQRTAM